MQETEAKFYVSDLDGIKARLQSLEAHLIQPRVLETNIRFDLPDGGLSSENQVLRLRQDTEAKLTYKSGSVNQGGILSRKEIEFIVDNYEKAKEFLEALGYQKLFYYEKYRITYELQVSDVSREIGELVHVMLDELPYGNFVEIEGESIESIRTVAEKLNLRWDTAIPTSYHVLFDRLCAKYTELDRMDLSFTSLHGLNVTSDDLSVESADK